MKRVFTIKYRQAFRKIGEMEYTDSIVARDVRDACNLLFRKQMNTELESHPCRRIIIDSVETGPEITL